MRLLNRNHPCDPLRPCVFAVKLPNRKDAMARGFARGGMPIGESLHNSLVGLLNNGMLLTVKG